MWSGARRCDGQTLYLCRLHNLATRIPNTYSDEDRITNSDRDEHWIANSDSDGDRTAKSHRAWDSSAN